MAKYCMINILDIVRVEGPCNILDIVRVEGPCSIYRQSAEPFKAQQCYYTYEVRVRGPAVYYTNCGLKALAVYYTSSAG